MSAVVDSPAFINFARFLFTIGDPAWGPGIKPRVERSDTLGIVIIKDKPSTRV